MACDHFLRLKEAYVGAQTRVVVVVVKLYLTTHPSSPVDDFNEGCHTDYILKN